MTRVGVVILPQLAWAQQKHLWLRAEEYGFDQAYTYDHLSWRTLADEPWGATVPVLTAAAALTSRITVGTFVTSPNYRHPVPFAKDVATLDDISGGRLLLGIGAGGVGFDSTVLGGDVLPPGPRQARFEEFTRMLDRLLRGETDGPISARGEWFTANAARMVGEPRRGVRTPFMIAANGPRGMRFAVEIGQSWVTTGPDGETGDAWWRGVADRAHRMDDLAEAAGARLDRVLSLDSGGYSLTSVDRFEDQLGRARDLGFTDVVVHWPRESGLYAGEETVLEQVASSLSSR